MANMDKKRKAEIDWCLNNEASEEWTQEWRDELTEEEAAYVQQQDEHYERTIAKICGVILILEWIWQRYRPEEVAELKTIGDHCRLRLCSGETFLVRLAPDGGVRMEKLVREGDGNVCLFT